MASQVKSGGEPTPMMVQYLALKAEAEGSLLFYRMGDFFELFFDDARAAGAPPPAPAGLAARAARARRGPRSGGEGGAPTRMWGGPPHAAGAYLARLIKAGHRVAIAEQVESPAE